MVATSIATAIPIDEVILLMLVVVPAAACARTPQNRRRDDLASLPLDLAIFFFFFTRQCKSVHLAIRNYLELSHPIAIFPLNVFQERSLPLRSAALRWQVHSIVYLVVIRSTGRVFI